MRVIGHNTRNKFTKPLRCGKLREAPCLTDRSRNSDAPSAVDRLLVHEHGVRAAGGRLHAARDPAVRGMGLLQQRGEARAHRALGRHRTDPDDIDLRLTRGHGQAGREAGANPTLHRHDLRCDAEGRRCRRAHFDGTCRDRRGGARGCARGADLQGRHGRRLCLQRLLSRLRFPADGVSLYPQQDHPARSQENDRHIRSRASSCR